MLTFDYVTLSIPWICLRPGLSTFAGFAPLRRKRGSGQVATFLAIVSDQAKYYRGRGVALPCFVHSTARFGGGDLRFNHFLRIPVVPQSLGLYLAELETSLRNRKIQTALRLGLLPCLAAAAALKQRAIGSVKGVW
jgi:hypothetical protein